MATRAQVRFATREDGVSFSEHPEKIHAQFYVHSDGYPEGLGLDIAKSFTEYGKIGSWEILKKGNNICILSVGSMVEQSMKAIKCSK